MEQFKLQEAASHAGEAGVKVKVPHDQFKELSQALNR
jgi:hypothetical protein